MRGKGMPVYNTSTRGDLMARLVVAVPQKLTPEQRVKLEEFSALMGDEVPAPSKGLFERMKDIFNG